MANLKKLNSRYAFKNITITVPIAWFSFESGCFGFHVKDWPGDLTGSEYMS
jgi:hypothetical protein